MNLSDKVQALLDSNISAYHIAKKTGVAQPVVTRLRSGERSIYGLSLGTAEKLAKYWDAAMIDLAVIGADAEQAKGFKDKLSALFDDLIDEQKAVSQSDEGMPDDMPMAYVLATLHDDIINDNVEIGRLVQTYLSHLK